MNYKNLHELDAIIEKYFRTGQDPSPVFIGSNHDDLSDLLERANDEKCWHVCLAALVFIQEDGCKDSSAKSPLFSNGRHHKRLIDVIVEKNLCEEAKSKIPGIVVEFLKNKKNPKSAYWISNAIFNASQIFASDYIDSECQGHLQFFLRSIQKESEDNQGLSAYFSDVISNGYSSSTRRMSIDSTEDFYKDKLVSEKKELIIDYFKRVIGELKDGDADRWRELLFITCGKQNEVELLSNCLDKALSEEHLKVDNFLIKLIGGSYFNLKSDFAINKIQNAIMHDSVDSAKLAKHLNDEDDLRVFERHLNLNVEYIFEKKDMTPALKRLLLSRDMDI